MACLWHVPSVVKIWPALALSKSAAAEVLALAVGGTGSEQCLL